MIFELKIMTNANLYSIKVTKPWNVIFSIHNNKFNSLNK